MSSWQILPFRLSRTESQVAGIALLWLSYLLVIEGTAWVLLHDPIHGVIPDFEKGMHYFVGPARDTPSLCRWDCTWYVQIANGPFPGAGESVHNTAFFPFFSLLMRGVARVFHIAPIWAGAWIARFALLGSMILLFFIARDFGLKEEERWAAVVGLVFSPDAFVLLSGYADGLFLLLSLIAFFLLFRDRPLRAAIPAFCAGLTRIHAFALIAGLGAFAVLRLWKGTNRKRALVDLVPAIACGLGILSFMAFLWRTRHDPLDFLHQQPFFGKYPGGPVTAWNALRETWTMHMPPDSLGNLYWGLQSVVAVVWVAVLVTLAYTRSWVALAYAGAIYAMSLSSGTHWGAWRYLADIFPVWFAIARLQRWRGVWSGVLFASAALQFCFLVNFVSLRGPAP